MKKSAASIFNWEHLVGSSLFLWALCSWHSFRMTKAVDIGVMNSLDSTDAVTSQRATNAAEWIETMEVWGCTTAKLDMINNLGTISGWGSLFYDFNATSNTISSKFEIPIVEAGITSVENGVDSKSDSSRRNQGTLFPAASYMAVLRIVNLDGDDLSEFRHTHHQQMEDIWIQNNFSTVLHHPFNYIYSLDTELVMLHHFERQLVEILRERTLLVPSASDGSYRQSMFYIVQVMTSTQISIAIVEETIRTVMQEYHDQISNEIRGSGTSLPIFGGSGSEDSRALASSVDGIRRHDQNHKFPHATLSAGVNSGISVRFPITVDQVLSRHQGTMNGLFKTPDVLTANRKRNKVMETLLRLYLEQSFVPYLNRVLPFTCTLESPTCPRML